MDIARPHREARTEDTWLGVACLFALTSPIWLLITILSTQFA